MISLTPQNTKIIPPFNWKSIKRALLVKVRGQDINYISKPFTDNDLSIEVRNDMDHYLFRCFH